jgi:hypothetical protein
MYKNREENFPRKGLFIKIDKSRCFHEKTFLKIYKSIRNGKVAQPAITPQAYTKKE